jgi:uncharacterized surface protein with fasciclin (FAS1) repeats
MNRIFISLFVFLILILAACGQAASTPEVVEPAQAPTQTPEVVVEPTTEPTPTPEVVLEPTPMPTEEPTADPTATASSAPAEEDLADKMWIFDILGSDESIKQFHDDLEGTGRFVRLEGAGPYTVFAPIYKSEDIPEGTITFFGQPPMGALEYHIVPGMYLEADLVALDGQSIATLVEGKNINISVEDGIVYLNDVAMVIKADILARNGVIHVIDKFLLPPAE